MAAPVWGAPDELWAVIEPLVPQRERRYRYPGRKRLWDGAALEASRRCW